MTGVSVREVRREDLPRVWTLIHGLAEYEKLTEILTGSPAQLEQALFGEPTFLFGLVAVTSDKIVGYALFHHTFSSFRTNPRMWLEDLYVEEQARGTGAGEALLRAFVKASLARGCHRVDWHVLAWNPAISFYERMGAQPSGDGMIQYGLDGTAMRKLAGEAES